MILSPFGPIYPILIPLPWETVWGSMCVLTELLDSQIQCIMLFFFFSTLSTLLRYHWHTVNDMFNMSNFITLDI